MQEYQKKGRNRANQSLKKKEWLMIAVALLACVVVAVFVYRPKTGDSIAVISVDGTEYMRINLRESEDQIILIQDGTGKPVNFEIKQNAIRFVNVTCPDHVCEKAGWCHSPGERAVCMPNRVTLICYEAGELAK